MQIPIIGGQVPNWKHAVGFALGVLIVLFVFNRFAPNGVKAVVYGGKAA